MFGLHAAAKALTADAGAAHRRHHPVLAALDLDRGKRRAHADVGNECAKRTRVDDPIVDGSPSSTAFLRAS